jgi:hypothetical protein
MAPLVLLDAYKLPALAAFLSLLSCVFLQFPAEARFASRFSLAVGEEYNDNIFFLKQRDHDFILHVTPTLSLLYQPAALTEPTFKLDITPTGQIFARHSEENNFGENLAINGTYDYLHSPRLSFHVSETFRLRGDTRTAGVGDDFYFFPGRTPTRPPSPGLPPSQRLGEFVSNGRTLDNRFAVQGRYLYSPDITLTGEYSMGQTAFLDRGGNDLSNSIGIRGIYHWQKEHNLHAGYRLHVLKSREGENNVVHDIDIGDDYFSSTQIQLSPTLTLAGSSGISLNTGNDGPRIANNSSVSVTKLWETAVLSAGARKGLTNSFGIAGVSDTTTFFSNFTIRLTERLSGSAGVTYSLFDTDGVDFKTLQASGGLQYAITTWLCSTLAYNHRRLDAGSGAQATDLQSRGNVYGNSVFLKFLAHFDIWPYVGLAKGATSCTVGLPRDAAQPAGQGLLQ